MWGLFFLFINNHPVKTGLISLKNLKPSSAAPYKEKVKAKANSLQSSGLLSEPRELARILLPNLFSLTFQDYILLRFVDLQFINLHNLWRCALDIDLANL